MDILDWIERAKNYDPDQFLSDFAMQIIEDEKAIDLQRQQWGEGADYKGRIIGFYKPATEELSGGIKKAGTPWTLDNTGDFWEKTYLNAVIKGKDLEFEFNSSGINKSALFDTIKKHGEIDNPDDIFGLYETYQIPFIELIEPKFVQQLNNYYDV